MYPRFRLRLPVLTLLGIAVFCSARVAFAQDPPAEPDPGQIEPAEKDVLEQNIYIPYEKLRQVFEKHGRGVFLPYEKFQELWDAARDTTAPPAEQQPPVKVLITETENEATVEKDVVKVKALLKIEVLAEGWHEVPLRLSDAAITSATLDGQPARITGTQDQGYRLLVENKGKQPAQIELALEYANKITKVPGRNSVSFEAPQAPVSRWRVRIPQSGVQVDIRPLIAAAEEPPAGQQEETVLRAFVGAAPTVRIEWTPKAEGAVGMAAVASVRAEQQVTIDEGVIRTSTTLIYKISRAELSQLTVEVPADHTVVDVVDDNVREWSFKPAGELQQITVELHDPAKQQQQVVVKLEKFAGDGPQESIQVPVVKAVGVDRQQGTVLVQVAEGLQAEVTKTSGLLQVDKSDNWAFCYRYATTTPPFELQLGIEKIQPRILVDSLIEAYLEPEQLSLDLLAIYTVEEAGVFRLELDVPAGYDVRHVRGRAASGAEAAVVDSHHTEGENDTRLVVNLRQKASGRVGLVVKLQKALDAPDLLTPTGKKIDIPLVIPRVVAHQTIHQDSGRLVIYAPESLEVNPSQSEGLREIPFEEAMQGMESVRPQKPSGVGWVMSREFTQDPVTLVLSAKRRRPQVNVQQLLVARVESGVVKYQATFYYEILYSSVKSLRIDVPTATEAGPAGEAVKWRNTSDKIQDTVIDPADPAAAEGYQAWSFTGDAKLIGPQKIVLECDYKIKDLDVGKRVKLRVPRLVPQGVDRARGQIVLAKSETIDLNESEEADEVKGVRGIDHQRELMPGAEVQGAARAFEFDEDWALTIVATQYELEEVPGTSIDRAVLRMVVTRAELISVQALYRIRSARQRLEVKLPDEAELDANPARINGNRVMLQIDKGNYFVPLVDQKKDEPFVLDLRYTVPGDGSRLDLPVFPENPAVLKVYLCAYLPEEWALLGTTGPWAEQFTWWLTPSLDWIPVHRRSDVKDVEDVQVRRIRAIKDVQQLNEQYADYLVAWVSKGVERSGDFQTDGRLYVFSTSCPAPTTDGSLTIKQVDERLLNAMVFIAVLLAGLLLTPQGVSGRALAIGVLIVVLVLGGVFLPTLSLQVLDGVLASAIFIVLVIWVVWYFVRTRPRALARRRAAAPPPPSPPAVPTPQEPEPRAPESEGEEPAEPESDQDAEPGDAEAGEPESNEGGKTDA